MEIVSVLLVILGLMLFEVVISIDNAIINAEVLGTMSAWARRWFLIWGIFIAVFLVRGLLPWLIVWIATPGLGPIEALTASFSGNEEIAQVIKQSSPILLAGGGTFLIFLFFHWLFIEPKSYGLMGEEFIHQRMNVWFFAIVSVLLVAIVWLSIKLHPYMAIGAVVGSSAFFITHGFKQNAEEMERRMLDKRENMSDWSKIFYLEVLDATFSIDGVLGAFAFTFSIPLILFGNGVGALVVRQLTVSNIENVKKYKYLKNGAMYSILCLGSVMLLHAFGFYIDPLTNPILATITHIPDWFTPVVTFIVVGYFFRKSIKEIRLAR